MTTILVRAARADEFATWHPLWRGYQAFYKVDIAESVSRITWQRFFDDAEPMHCDLAEVDGVVRGLVHSIDHRSCWIGRTLLLPAGPVRRAVDARPRPGPQADRACLCAGQDNAAVRACTG